jgi:hypothetical protein
MCLALTQTLTPALSRRRERGKKQAANRTPALTRRRERGPNEPEGAPGIHPLSLWERVRVRVSLTRLHPALA